jgi:hypothetical protein
MATGLRPFNRSRGENLGVNARNTGEIKRFGRQPSNFESSYLEFGDEHVNQCNSTLIRCSRIQER